jgi:hypothetical protein
MKTIAIPKPGNGSLKAGDDQPQAVTVTNNLSPADPKAQLSADIVVISGKNNDDDSAGVIYSQDVLTMFSTSNGSSLIAQGSNATIALSDPIYNLIVAESKYLYPIQVVGDMQDINTGAYTPVTVAQADLVKMKLAEQFNQVIAAYPTSKMSVDYQNTLTEANKTVGSIADIDDALAKFFKRYPTYQTLDLNAITALSTYYKKFPFTWATYKSSYTYYLYSSDSSSVNYQGKLELTSSNAPVPADVKDGNGGFTIKFTDANDNATDLIYDQGQFVSGIDTPFITLQGMYVLKSSFTKKSDDNYLVPVMTGTVSGTPVLGSKDKKTDTPSDAWSFFHPKSFAGWMTLIGAMLGLIMGIDFLSGGAISEKLKALREKLSRKKVENKGKEPSKEEFDEIKNRLDELDAKLEMSQSAILDRLNLKIQPPKDFASGAAQLQMQENELIVEDKKASANDKLEIQENNVKELAEYKVDNDIEDIVLEIKQNKKELVQSNSSPTVDEISANIDKTTSKITTVKNSMESELSVETQNTFKQNELEMQEIQEEEEQIKADESNSENGKDPEIKPNPEEEL